MGATTRWPVRVLLVEPSQRRAALAERAFRHTTFPAKVLRAEDGGGMVRLLAATRAAELPNVIVDMGAPERGPDLQSRLQASRRWAEIPVVALPTQADYDTYVTVARRLEAYWLTVSHLPR